MPRTAFQGKKIDFSNRRETLEDVFGTQPITIGNMQKMLWTFIKDNKLMK